MVQVPEIIRKFLNEQGVFVVGSVGGTKFCNVSPRIFFDVTEDSIYWLDFFKHKSYRNFNVNPWVTVGVFDKQNLTGYQMRGKVNFVSKETEKNQIREKIIRKTLPLQNSPKAKKLSERECQVVKFVPTVIYMLDPEKYSDLSIGSDIDQVEFMSKWGK